jgi:anti-anti-sigma factor
MNSTIKFVEPSGILDSTKANQFRQEISELIEKKVDVVVIDFKNVDFMDSSGLGALVLSLKTVRMAGAQLLICSINEQIKMLFELTNMDRVFEIFSNREELQQKLLSELPNELNS